MSQCDKTLSQRTPYTLRCNMTKLHREFLNLHREYA